MTIDNTLAAKCDEAKETRAEKAIRALMSLDGDPKYKKRKEFENFYPAVLHAINRKIPRKTILKHLRDGGLKLYPALFEEFMTSMAQALEARGESNACSLCGQPIENFSTADHKRVILCEGQVEQSEEPVAAGEPA